MFRRRRRRFRRLVFLGAAAGAAYAYRNRKLIENQRRFGLPQ